MYLTHFGLSRKPFSKTPDPSMLFEGPVHAEALARMEQAVEDRELMVLTGEIGCGKTTLSRALLDRLPDAVRPALIINPALSPNQLLRTIAMRLGEDNPRHYRSDLIEQVHGLLFKCYEAEVLPLLIIDEAQAIPSRETFEEVRMLTNFQLDDQNLMAVLLMGQPELARRLRHPAYEALRQRIGLTYHLGPLEPGAVGEYLRHRLAQAGRTTPLFDDDAVAAIARLSRGIPRWVNNLASTCLLGAFALEADRIDRALVEDAARDLGLIGRDGEPVTDHAGDEPAESEKDD